MGLLEQLELQPKANTNGVDKTMARRLLQVGDRLLLSTALGSLGEPACYQKANVPQQMASSIA